MFARAALLVFALLASAGAAFATPGVVHGPGLDTADAAVRAKNILGTGDFKVLGSIDGLTGPAGTPVVIGATVQRCEQESEPIGRVLVRARSQVLELDYQAGSAALTAAVDALPCGAAEATREELFQLFFLQGYMHFNEGDTEAARAAFTRAAVIDRTKDWPSDYPPTAEAEYLKGLKAAVNADPARLVADVDSLSVDGEAAVVAKPPGLLAGDHLLTVNGIAMWVSVPADAETVRVTTAGRLAAGILEGDVAYAGWLGEVGAREGVSEVLVLTPNSTVLFTDGTFVESSSSADEKRAAAPPGPKPVGAVLAGSGGAMLGVGLGLHFSGYAAAGLGDDGGVQASEQEYPGLLTRNRAGFGLAVAGAAVLGTGMVLVVVSELAGRPVAVVPFVAPARDAASVGLVGRF